MSKTAGGLCRCGSGKRYKRCCKRDDEARRSTREIPPHLVAQLQQQHLHSLTHGPEPIRATFKGKVFRAIGPELHIRPAHETFHEWILDTLKRTLGKPWLDCYKQPNERSHVVMRWLYSFSDLVNGALADPARNPADGVEATGTARALLALAYDVHSLLVADRLTPQIQERLRNPAEFQGVRYEVAIAAIFVRAGYDVEWIPSKAGRKSCEFAATQRLTGDLIAVEVKSRRRKGTLNEPGEPPAPEGIRVDAQRLFREALQQNPGDKPFAIFIDLNLPYRSDERGVLEESKPILNAAGPISAEQPAPYTFMALTSWPWHYDGESPATRNPYFLVTPQFVRWPIRDSGSLALIQRELHTYGSVPRDL